MIPIDNKVQLLKTIKREKKIGIKRIENPGCKFIRLMIRWRFYKLTFQVDNFG
jgi:hypothetical protein